MREQSGTLTKEAKIAKLVQQGDALEFQKMVDRWRVSNGLAPLYGREKQKQDVIHD
jgi:hypothetical protein